MFIIMSSFQSQSFLGGKKLMIWTTCTTLNVSVDAEVNKLNWKISYQGADSLVLKVDSC